MGENFLILYESSFYFHIILFYPLLGEILDKFPDNSTVISAGFLGWGGSTKSLRARFSRVGKILLFGKALKFGVVFQKICIKIIKIWISIAIFWGKMQIFFANLFFRARLRKSRIFIERSYNADLGESREARKEMHRNRSCKNANFKLLFQRFEEVCCADLVKNMINWSSFLGVLPDTSEPLQSFPIFFSCHLNFHSKLIIYSLKYKGFFPGVIIFSAYNFLKYIIFRKIGIFLWIFK